jgi:uncharacterized membrane protein YcaP (DUF421 family)
MHSWLNTIEGLLGIGKQPQHLDFSEVALRATVMFIAALVMLRMAHKRFFAHRNALDVLISFVLASTLARAINGSAPFFATLGVGFVLVGLHRFLAWLAARVPAVEQLVKGHATVLVEGGEVREHALRRHDLSREDLREDLRINGVARPEEARRAVLERNGEISVEKSD